jgi:hypothetical protein
MNLLRTQNTQIAALKDIGSQKTDNKKTAMILRQGSCPKDEKPGES